MQFRSPLLFWGFFRAVAAAQGEDAVGVGPTVYNLALDSPRFLFVFPSYSITVLTFQP